MARLYMVATPIGNLEDITYRAVRILGTVDVVAAEDTRVTRKLLDRFKLSPAKVISARAANEKAASGGIVKLLERGLDVAYVSDSGTPAVSDPGGRTAAAAREAGFDVVPIPGACAAAALISAAGIAGKGFVLEGFLSPKGPRRRRRLEELLAARMVFVIYESPYRILKLLADLAHLAPERKVLIGREITKKFEEIITGTAKELLAELSSRGTVKGEFSVVIGILKES